MQITKVEVVPVELKLRLPYRTAYRPDVEIDQIAVVFIRLETQQGLTAWGCAAFDENLTGETLDAVLRSCRACADVVQDLSPLNTEYALGELSRCATHTPSALCAFDIALYDLLGLAAGLPLHRLLGGYRDRIQTSATIRLAPVQETVKLAQERARQGFRILKVKGGVDPDQDVERIRAIRRALPGFTLRLDAEQGYTARQALAVARALKDDLEMLEQPLSATDLDGMQQITARSQVPILADESVTAPQTAMEVATRRAANGLSIKLATCGGFHPARQIDIVARLHHMATMVSCVNEPALLTAAGLAFALSSANVRYGDLDGYLDLVDDPTVAGFCLEEGVLVATDVPGLGCTVAL